MTLGNSIVFSTTAGEAIARLLLLLSLLFSPAAFPLERVTVQLKWHHQFQFAGLYAAQFQGFYKAAGLDVTLMEAPPSTDVVALVLSGQANYGIGGSDLLRARAAGQPVVALAAIFQHSPMTLLTLERDDLQQLKDLAGKRLMLEPHGEELTAMLLRNRVTPANQQPHTQDLTPLLDGRVDAMSAYSTDEPYQLTALGIPYRLFTPRDAGIDFYGDVLFTTDKELALHPKRVHAFREATLKGWRYALDNPDRVIDWLLANHPSSFGRAALEFEARETGKLMEPEVIEPGYMQPERWRAIGETYRSLGLITAIPDLTRFLYDPAARQFRLQAMAFDRTLAIGILIAILLGLTLIIFCHLYLRLKRESRQRQRLTGELAEREQHYRFVTENSADVIWTMDVATLRFTYISPAIRHLLELTPGEAMALPLQQLMTDGSLLDLQKRLQEALVAWDQGAYRQTRQLLRLALYHRRGHLVTTEVTTTLHGDQRGRPHAILGVTRDISERIEHEEMMQRLAFHDQLTNLPNRRLLQRRLGEALTRGEPLAIVFIDLDHFKPINDTLGHEVGDALLVLVAERMLDTVRAQDLVARLGGDEFVMLLPGMGDEALSLADTLHHNLAIPFHMASGETLHISSSIGVALYPEHGKSARELMHHADQAMYQAKRNGRGRVALYSQALDPNQETLNWSASQECGHPRLDAEHRQLLVLTNRLLERAQEREQSPAPFLEALRALVEATRHHFAYEEEVLSHLGYRDLADHHQAHQELLLEAERLLAAARSGELGGDQLLNFVIQDLVVGHMSQCDRRYFSLVRSLRRGP